MQVETSVHGQPVAGIVSLPQAGDEPTLLRSSTLLMQKVRCPNPPSGMIMLWLPPPHWADDVGPALAAQLRGAGCEL